MNYTRPHHQYSTRNPTMRESLCTQGDHESSGSPVQVDSFCRSPRLAHQDRHCPQTTSTWTIEVPFRLRGSFHTEESHGQSGTTGLVNGAFFGALLLALAERLIPDTSIVLPLFAIFMLLWAFSDNGMLLSRGPNGEGSKSAATSRASL